MKKLKTILCVMALMLSLTLPVQAKAETEVPEIDSSYGNDLALPAGATRKLVVKGNKISYYYNGKMVKNCWKRYQGYKYYFGPKGYAARGGAIINNVAYVFDAKGRLIENKANSIVNVESNRYYVTTAKGRVATGYFIYQDNLYYADPKGRLYRNCSKQYGQIYFTSSGAARRDYNALLKMRTMQIVSAITSPGMTQSQKLYACWSYVVSDGGFYYGGPDPNLDESGWARNEALRMFNTGVGNCYGFSCIFAALVREIGYTPYMICGRVPGTRDGAADGFTRHCWVEIDGLYYDPEAHYAGWMSGVYGYDYYPIAHQIQRVVNFKKF